MKHSIQRSAVAALIALSGIVGASAASAATPRRADAGLYQRELAMCGQIQQDRAACIQEAGAARQAAARGDLSTSPDYLGNAMARCARQMPPDRAACEARVQGGNRTSVEGSVLGGGLIYETVTPIPPR